MQDGRRPADGLCVNRANACQLAAGFATPYFTSFRVASGALEQVGAHVAREPERLGRADQERVS
jgi:hypothetical protein